MKNNEYKIIASDCPVCYESNRVYSGRMKMKGVANRYCCDGCGNTMTDELIDEKWKAIKSKE